MGMKGVRRVALLFGALAHEIAVLVSSVLAATAEDAGAAFLVSGVSRVLAGRNLQRKVQQAVQRAFARWLRDVEDPELVRALGRMPRLQHDATLVVVLAHDALMPALSHEHAPLLAARLHTLMPGISETRCQRAAAILIADLHDETVKIARLRGRTMREELKAGFRELRPLLRVPPYEPGLRAALEREADQIQRALGHTCITAAHLLYALIALPDECDRVARNVLRNEGVDAEQIRAALARKVAPRDDATYAGLTESARAVLEDAQVLAQKQHARQTRSGHVLEALARQATRRPTGSIAAVFAELELPPVRIQEQAIVQGQRDELLSSVVE